MSAIRRRGRIENLEPHDDAYYRRLREGFSEFMHAESTGALLLVVAAAISLVLANSPVAEEVYQFWETHAGLFVDGFEFEQSLLHWVDDALMALFFFVVGLEIKREFIVGELSSIRGAALPLLAALGGMAVPALLYASINAGGVGEPGWGIPMATDIAFALGVLALLGSRVPPGLRVFLAALAIVDDIGAILVIALFYTETVAYVWLGLAVALLILLASMNRVGVDNPFWYMVVGTVVWFAFLNSGIHATIAGVLVAFTIPVRAKVSPFAFTEWARGRLEEIDTVAVPDEHCLVDDRPQLSALEVRDVATHTASPLQRLEFWLLPYTTFFILPVFALANAGVKIGSPERLASPIALGIIVGLLIGKPVGITLLSWLAVRLGLSDLPTGVRWSHLVGVAALAGMGFTMSLFISNLAFSPGEELATAKVAILVASLVAGVVGYLVLRLTLPASR